ncbi:MAG TPA: sugar phosphate isomerase/epimerase family protein [Bryobacteraceae bacterium]|jgi:sugar phosphate isomerase/epimerase
MFRERRAFLKASAAAPLALSLQSKTIAARPRLGVVIGVAEQNPDQAIAKVHALGFPTCQLHVGMAPSSLAAPLKEALSKYEVDATAVMTLGSGRMVWDFYEGPKTIGLVPPSTRAARIDALKRASDLAKRCEIGAVHTHCGFIPEDPSDPLYPQAVSAIKDVARHCKQNGQIFLMETGQETPITMLRAIQDTGLDNVYVNLDTANLILYGKGEPVGALDVIGTRVRGLHAKDGLYPTDPRKLGKEVPIGKGRVNFPELMRRLRQVSYSGPITIEREISGLQQEADIRSSKAYLERLIEREYGQ